MTRTPNFPQKTKVLSTKTGNNFTVAHVGPLSDLTRYAITHPVLNRETPGKVFLQEVLGTTGLEMSLGVLPPGRGIPFLHKHKQNEEVYFIVSGQGQIQVDGDVTDVSEGSAIRIAPDGARSLRNTGSAPLVYAVMQATQGSLSQWTATDGIPMPDPVQWP